MTIPFDEIVPKDNDQTRARLEHLDQLRSLVGNAYPNKFERSHLVPNSAEGEDTISAIISEFSKYAPQVDEGQKPSAEEIQRANGMLNEKQVRVSGRLATPPRVMGKAAFVHLSDGASRLQIYVRKADVRAVNNDTGALLEDAEAGWKLFNLLDHGDFIGVAGFLFVTKTGELSVHVTELQFLAKALLPMPDKMHGISDPEIRQRQRYADLIAGSLKIRTDDDAEKDELTAREVFIRRSRIITEMRRFLDQHGYIEVETPMLTPKATGAAAKPFKTHHNALDIDLYARIAPELYLKRLLVGGFERVYELNRNFRNEGISTRHNPEFTMLEFYTAYKDVNWMMDFCEEQIATTIEKVLGTTTVQYGEYELDFNRPWKRLGMKDAIERSLTKKYRVLWGEDVERSWLDDPSRVLLLDIFALDQLSSFGNLRELEASVRNSNEEIMMGLDETAVRRKEESEKVAISLAKSKNIDEVVTGKRIERLFSIFVEDDLIQPTFIYDFPKVISPLSKASPTDPMIAERFELYINGMEVANGFSELNAPEEQYERFVEQMQQRERGDEEAMVLDEDYIRALAYGMPPAAGIGIGIDRLTMLLTNRHSVRDVILFPHLRPERKPQEESQEEESQARE